MSTSAPAPLVYPSTPVPPVHLLPQYTCPHSVPVPAVYLSPQYACLPGAPTLHCTCPPVHLPPQCTYPPVLLSPQCTCPLVHLSLSMPAPPGHGPGLFRWGLTSLLTFPPIYCLCGPGSTTHKLRTRTQELDFLGANSRAASHLLCHLWQVT